MPPTVWQPPVVSAHAEEVRAGFAAISAALAAGDLRRAQPAAFSPEQALLGEITRVLEAAPRAAWPRLAVAFNEDQVESKLWLAARLQDALDPSGYRIVILGAWYGVLALILDRLMPARPAEVHCIDIDAPACAIAERLVNVLTPAPRVTVADMMTIDYAQLVAGSPTFVINTSCEHLADVPAWRARLPAGTRVLLQSNNHRGCPEHISCVDDLAGFEAQARLADIEFRGTLPLRHFNRFMLIGRA